MLVVNDGRPIAIFDDDDEGFLGIIDPDNEKIKKGSQVGTTIEFDETITPVPNLENRFIEYIAGPSGSGKSTMATNLAEIFAAENPKIPIFVFSRTKPEDDNAFDNLDVIVIELGENLIQNPIDITKQQFSKGCLMIFDDVSTVHSDAVKNEVNKLITDAMEVGRKLNCNMIITNHLVIPNEKKLARTVMNELNMLTVFPKSGSSQQIRYALKTYFGLDNKQIDFILRIPSRWVRISKGYPMYVLYDKGAYIL